MLHIINCHNWLIVLQYTNDSATFRRCILGNQYDKFEHEQFYVFHRNCFEYNKLYHIGDAF